jgi:alpha-methylacyl-CoA racemase
MTASQKASGPLAGVKVVEIAGLGPAPHACMLLSDMGAEIIRIDRPGAQPPDPTDATQRGRIGTVVLDLKAPADVSAALDLIAKADILVEAFRPGVMERLGLGPDVARARNERLIYGRMTGWGQSGPLAMKAGHDINYISLSGALAGIGLAGQKPTVPLNLVGDFGGGSLYLVVGLLAALVERATSGKGQVVDAAVCDGVASLMAMPNWLYRSEVWEGREERGANAFDGGRFYYNCYECADGKFVAVGAGEPQFFRQLCEGMGVADDPDFAVHGQELEGAKRRIEMAERIFRSKTQEEWCAIFADRDACFTPVLWSSEAPTHPHHQARGVLVEVAGVPQPAPAPRFDRTPGEIQGVTPVQPIGLAAALRLWD